MPTNRNRSTTAFTTGRGQLYTGGTQGPSMESGGRLSYRGRVISHQERYRNIIRALNDQDGGHRNVT